jgi:DNA polymerase-3 subunit epsilon
MKLNLKKPLVFFDLETTGINVTKDRIIEAAFIKVHPDGSEEEKHYLVHPKMPIPPENSAIHGIFDKDVHDKPTFEEIAPALLTFLKGCDLGGYNLLKFDIPLLIEEFLRNDFEYNIDQVNIIDSQVIFYMMEPRTLTGALKYYCDKTLKDAHSALADTRATLDVFKGQIQMYDGVKIDRNGESITPVKNDVQHIHNYTANNFPDLAGRLCYNASNEIALNFGKYKGKSVSWVFDREPGYYDWMMKGDFPTQTKRVITRIKLEKFANK